MRIAQFTESYRPVINGVAVAVDLLADELAPRHTVEIFAPRFPGHQDPTGGPARVHRFCSYIWPRNPDYPLAIPVSPTIFADFKTTGFDVVHTHSPFALGQTGRRWARRLGIPVVTTYHTLYVEYAHYASVLPERWVRPFLQDLSRRYCNAVDAVAVPTAPIRDVLLEYGVTRPISVVPTGLRLDRAVALDPGFPREALNIPANAPLVLYAGRLAREKNLELLFEGFARAARQVPNAWMLVAGNGPSEHEALRLAEATGVAQRIAFAGFVPPERMASVFAAADVFAFASLTDTQGLVLTEAKAAGVPAVSVNAYGPSAVVTNDVDGFLTPNCPEAFGAALVRLLSDGELRARMSAGALREARRFSIEATAAAYEELYEEARRSLGRGIRKR
ncbi:MAG: glycosyl transferase family 1 [Armatimonadetes bacterium]|jgi:glycosyltransferase involved in cell wall biosynthesis|nr:glycosyl transferase family 1 [Armatimonadota bacterium]